MDSNLEAIQGSLDTSLTRSEIAMEEMKGKMSNVKTLDEILVVTQKQIDKPIKEMANVIEQAIAERERKITAILRDHLTEPELYGSEGLPTMGQYLM